MLKRKLTKSLINKVLKEASFDPKGDKALNIIMDISDCSYFGSRAIEHVAESLTQPYTQSRLSMLRAIGLLALGILVLDTYGGTTKKVKERKSRSKDTGKRNNVSEKA